VFELELEEVVVEEGCAAPLLCEGVLDPDGAAPHAGPPGVRPPLLKPPYAVREPSLLP